MILFRPVNLMILKGEQLARSSVEGASIAGIREKQGTHERQMLAAWLTSPEIVLWVEKAWLWVNNMTCSRRPNLANALFRSSSTGVH